MKQVLCDGLKYDSLAFFKFRKIDVPIDQGSKLDFVHFPGLFLAVTRDEGYGSPFREERQGILHLADAERQFLRNPFLYVHPDAFP